MPLLLTIAASALWFVLWAIIAAMGSAIFGNPELWLNHNETLSSCLPPNLIRSGLYTVLFVGSMLIARHFYLNGTSLEVKFLAKPKFQHLLKTAKSHLVTSKNQNGFWLKMVGVLGLILTWLFCWFMVSEVLYFFTASNFMGDCDVGDMECHCDNRLYLTPIFAVTAILGCVYVSALAIVRGSSRIVSSTK